MRAPADIIDAVLTGKRETARGGVILAEVADLFALARRGELLTCHGLSGPLDAALAAVASGDEHAARAALRRVPLDELVPMTPTGPLVESVPGRVY